MLDSFTDFASLTASPYYHIKIAVHYQPCRTLPPFPFTQLEAQHATHRPRPLPLLISLSWGKLDTSTGSFEKPANNDCWMLSNQRRLLVLKVILEYGVISFDFIGQSVPMDHKVCRPRNPRYPEVVLPSCSERLCGPCVYVSQ